MLLGDDMVAILERSCVHTGYFPAARDMLIRIVIAVTSFAACF